MRARIWLAIALGLMLAACVPAVAQTPGAAGAATPTVWAPKKVTLDLKDVPMDEAIRRVVAATDLSVLIAGEIPKAPRVTMRLTENDPREVLQLLSYTGGFSYNESQRGERREPAVVLLFQREAPLPPQQAPQPTRGPAAAPVPALPWTQVTQVATNVTVDLDLSNTPFRDAVAEIVKQIPANDQWHIVVDDSVPKDLRVTARVRKMRWDWVLDSLVEQAGLTYGLQDDVDPKFLKQLSDLGQGQAGLSVVPPNAPRLRTVYIVPKPELRVSSGGK
jgi:hypothetical protein